MAPQQIDRDAERRVGRDPRVAIRATALKPDRQVADGDLRARDVVGVRQHFVDQVDAASHRLARAPGFLDVEGLEQRIFREVLGGEQIADLVGFAAEPDHEHTAEIDVPRVAGERAAQDVNAFACRAHAAARSHGERDNAIDVRVCGERLGMGIAIEVAGNRTGDRGRAVDAGENAEVIAGGDTAVRTDDPLKGARYGRVIRWARLDADRVVAREGAAFGAHAQVMDVDVRAGFDVGRREPDDLVVAAYGFALRNAARGDLVAGRNQPPHGDRPAFNGGARQHLLARNHHIVSGVQPDHRFHADSFLFLDGAGHAGHVVFNEKRVDERNRQRAEQGSRHQRAPMVDVALDEFSHHAHGHGLDFRR